MPFQLDKDDEPKPNPRRKAASSGLAPSAHLIELQNSLRDAKRHASSSTSQGDDVHALQTVVLLRKRIAIEEERARLALRLEEETQAKDSDDSQVREALEAESEAKAALADSKASLSTLSSRVRRADPAAAYTSLMKLVESRISKASDLHANLVEQVSKAIEAVDVKEEYPNDFDEKIEQEEGSGVKEALEALAEVDDETKSLLSAMVELTETQLMSEMMAINRLSEEAMTKANSCVDKPAREESTADRIEAISQRTADIAAATELGSKSITHLTDSLMEMVAEIAAVRRVEAAMETFDAETVTELTEKDYLDGLAEPMGPSGDRYGDKSTAPINHQRLRVLIARLRVQERRLKDIEQGYGCPRCRGLDTQSTRGKSTPAKAVRGKRDESDSDEGSPVRWEESPAARRPVSRASSRPRSAVSDDSLVCACIGHSNPVRTVDSCPVVLDRHNQPLQGPRDAGGRTGRVVFASGDLGGHVRMWTLVEHTKTALFLHSYECGSEGVSELAFHPSGRSFATAGLDGSIRMWDVSKTKMLHSVEMDSSVTSVAFSPTGERMAAGAFNSVLIMDSHEMRPLTVLEKAHGLSVYSACFHPERNILLTAGDDNAVRLWDLRSGRCINTYSGHTGWVYRARFTDDGSHVISASKDGSVQMWPYNSNWLTRSFNTGHGMGGIHAAETFGDALFVAGDDHCAHVFDMKSGTSVQTMQGHHGLVYDVTFLPRRKLVVSCGGDTLVKLWSLKGQSKSLARRQVGDE